MIKILKIRKTEGVNITVDLIADTKEEVTGNAEIVGLTSAAEIQIGSTCLTVNGDYAICNSNGEWVWADEEEETVSASPQSLNISRPILDKAVYTTNAEFDTEEQAEI